MRHYIYSGDNMLSRVQGQILDPSHCYKCPNGNYLYTGYLQPKIDLSPIKNSIIVIDVVISVIL